MLRNIALVLLLSFVLPLMVACGSGAAPITILPEDCDLIVEQELSLTIEGSIPPRATVRWDVDHGDITFILTGLEAVYVAPSEPAVVTISALVSSPVSGMTTAVTRQCIVKELNRAPGGLAQTDWFDELFSQDPQ